MDKFTGDFSTYNVDSMIAEMEKEGKTWHAFLPGENLLTGLYVLPAGSDDPQKPHETDEVYFVLEGEAKITVNGEVKPVAKGDVIFVKALAEHHFFAIEKDIKLLVFFDQ